MGLDRCWYDIVLRTMKSFYSLKPRATFYVCILRSSYQRNIRSLSPYPLSPQWSRESRTVTVANIT